MKQGTPNAPCWYDVVDFQGSHTLSGQLSLRIFYGMTYFAEARMPVNFLLSRNAYDGQVFVPLYFNGMDCGKTMIAVEWDGGEMPGDIMGMFPEGPPMIEIDPYLPPEEGESFPEEPYGEELPPEEEELPPEEEMPPPEEEMPPEEAAYGEEAPPEEY